MKKMITQKAEVFFDYVKTFAKWIIIALITGVIGGTVGALFHISIDYATSARTKNPWVIFLLPLGGILIAFLYKVTGMQKNGGTNNVINSVKEKEKIPARLAPLIFVSTVITHFFGGSVGREGAALQLGGSIGAQVAKIFGQKRMNDSIVIMCGMSSVFSALFGTPLTAAVFAMEVISVGIIHYSGFVPCMISALVAYGIAGAVGIAPVRFSVAAFPSFGLINMGRIVLLSAMCAVVSIAFCLSMKKASKAARHLLKNIFVRAAVGGAIVVVLTMCFGRGRYNGAGMEIVYEAVAGNAFWYDFLLKIIFTAVSLASGFKGGEIVPAFFVGASFGCVAGSVVGLNGGFAASVGLVALFCGVVNCPLASVMLAAELFGGEGLIYYALAAGISYMLSGYYGLYSGQTIVYSKLRAEYINRQTK